MASSESATVSATKKSKVKSDPSSKPKREKSSKKRKAEVLTDSAPSIALGRSDSKDLNSSSAPSPTQQGELAIKLEDNAPPSKKRKAVVKEIEVDITAPEPPSKKALRRLRKGKPLPPSKSGAEPTPEPDTKPAKKAEVEKRSEHGIWIGNLPWHISKAELRKFLVENSDITEEMITRVHMPGPNDSKPANKVEDQRKFVKPIHNKGFAYVDFSTAEAAKWAVELSEQLLSGRRVLIKNHKSFEGRPEKTKEETRKDGKPPSTRVFLGNLSFDTTEDSLKEHFEKCGAIVNVKVATFEDTGKCKGYAWITFEELEGAESAVRGFTRIEEPLSDASESEDEDDSDTGPKIKKMKTRKWWVNKIKGRPLRMEFAEDAQVRYKKRYGKDGTQKDPNVAQHLEEAIEKNVKVEVAMPMKKAEYMLPYGGPRLTGGIVESKGTKVTF